MYSLEVIQLTKSELNKLDAFQMKGLRRILKIPSTVIDRAQTNQVSRTAKSKHAWSVYLKLSDFWRQRKISLLGHILRADANRSFLKTKLASHENHHIEGKGG